LREVGDGASGSGLYVAADDGGMRRPREVARSLAER